MRYPPSRKSPRCSEQNAGSLDVEVLQSTWAVSDRYGTLSRHESSSPG